MEALLLVAALAQRPVQIVIDEGHDSKALVSEYHRDWPLGCCVHEIECDFEVEFVPYYETAIRGPFPAVIVQNQPPFRIRAAASGEALLGLHRRLTREARSHFELMDQSVYYGTGDCWAWRTWNDDGTPEKPRPVDEE